MLEEELASLPQSPGVSAGISPAPAAGEGINVQVEIAANLIDKIKPGAMLFLVARVPDKPGPPLAAVRQGESSFPTVIRIRLLIFSMVVAFWVSMLLVDRGI